MIVFFDEIRYHIMKYFRMWSGPISISIFVPEVEMDAARMYIEYLRKCNRKLKEQATFHFMFPYEKPPITDLRKMREVNDDDISTNASRRELLNILAEQDYCSDTNFLLKKIFSSRRYELTNIMRLQTSNVEYRI